MDSDEDDGEPQNAPGTSSNSQPTVPVLHLQPSPAANAQGPADISVDEDSEYSDEYRAQSQDSQRTQYYPDLYVLTNDELWTMTPETQVCSIRWIFYFRDYRKWRSTGHMQLDHFAVCTTIIVPH